MLWTTPFLSFMVMSFISFILPRNMSIFHLSISLAWAELMKYEYMYFKRKESHTYVPNKGQGHLPMSDPIYNNENVSIPLGAKYFPNTSSTWYIFNWSLYLNFLWYLYYIGMTSQQFITDKTCVTWTTSIFSFRSFQVWKFECIFKVSIPFFSCTY